MKNVALLLLWLLVAGCSTIPSSDDYRTSFDEPIYRKKSGYHFQTVMPMYYERTTITQAEYRILPHYVQISYEKVGTDK